MTNDKDKLPPEVEQYLNLCKRIYERMLREGTWPWTDSPDFSDVVESDNNSNDI